MKTITKVLLSILFVLPIGLMAQSSFDEIFKQHEDSDDVTSISIDMSGIRVNFGSDFFDGDLEEIIEQVDNFRVLVFENHYKSFRKSDLWEEVNAIIDKEDFVQLIDVKSNDENVGIYMKKGRNNRITEALIIAQDDDEATLVHVKGNMLPADLMRMSSRNHWGHSHKYSKSYHKRKHHDGDGDDDDDDDDDDGQ